MKLRMAMSTSVKFEALTDLHKATIAAQALVDYDGALLRFEHKDDADLQVEVFLPYDTLVYLLRDVNGVRFNIAEGGEVDA